MQISIRETPAFLLEIEQKPNNTSDHCYGRYGIAGRREGVADK